MSVCDVPMLAPRVPAAFSLLPLTVAVDAGEFEALFLPLLFDLLPCMRAGQLLSTTPYPLRIPPF